MDIDSFLNRQKWIFAKTYADKAPHEYCLREQVVGTDEEFAQAVQWIRDNGIPMNYWTRQHVYYFMGGRMYWTMGAPIDQTILINRCNVADYDIKMQISWRGNK